MSTPPQEPEAARGVSGRREARTSTPCLPYFLYRRRLHPLPVSSFFHRRLHLQVMLTVGERALIPNLYGVWPSSQGRGDLRAPCRVTAAPSRCVMPAFEPRWDIFSCRCRSRLRHARTPLVVLPFLFRHLFFPVVMSPPWSRPSPWPWPRRAHARTLTLIHAPCTRGCARVHQGRSKSPTLLSPCPSTEVELGGVPPRRAEAPLSVVPFHPDVTSAGTFLSSLSYSLAHMRGPS
jgi:hypothetical protein